MNIPEFTAQASLYRTSNHYRSFGQRSEQQRTIVIPQLGGRGFVGRANCLIDCADQHPDWTAARCSARCRDPGGTTVVHEGGYGPSCDDSPPFECGFWFAVCCP